MEEIWSDKSVHILVDILTKWLGHTKAMFRHRNRPRYGTVICFLWGFVFLLILFLVVLGRIDHLEHLLNYTV